MSPPARRQRPPPSGATSRRCPRWASSPRRCWPSCSRTPCWRSSGEIPSPKSNGTSMATFRTSQPGSAADPSVPHLILVGLPGAGKSTVGSALARELDRSFLDFDSEIARREGMTISEIFAQKGEPSFRLLEHALTDELRAHGGMVLAPGGGWVGRPETVALIRPPARMIYL